MSEQIIVVISEKMMCKLKLYMKHEKKYTKSFEVERNKGICKIRIRETIFLL